MQLDSWTPHLALPSDGSIGESSAAGDGRGTNQLCRLAWVSVFGAEASAFRILIEFWITDEKYTPLWISIFLIINLCIHFSPVRVFGEVEFFVSSLKVIAILGFIIVTWVIMGGGGPTGHVHGGEYCKSSDDQLVEVVYLADP